MRPANRVNLLRVDINISFKLLQQKRPSKYFQLILSTYIHIFIYYSISKSFSTFSSFPRSIFSLPHLIFIQYIYISKYILFSCFFRESSTVSHGLIEYHKAAGIRERIQPTIASSASTALALKNPYATAKPEWHPPWKLMRVISAHLGWVRSVAVDPSNEWFATGAADRTIKVIISFLISIYLYLYRKTYISTWYYFIYT